MFNTYRYAYLCFSIFIDLYSELVLFEEWIIAIEEQLAKFNAIRNENITSDDLQELMVRYRIFN